MRISQYRDHEGAPRVLPLQSEDRRGLYRSTYLENWGSGAKRIIDACREQGVEEPTWRWDGAFVYVTFQRPMKHMGTPQAETKSDPATDHAGGKSEQPQPKSEQATDHAGGKSEQPQPKSEQATAQAGGKSEQPQIKLSKKQIEIRDFCSEPPTAKEIMERLGLSNFYNNRKRYIYDLAAAGVLEPTIPDKPNDPNQKYRRKG